MVATRSTGFTGLSTDAAASKDAGEAVGPMIAAVGPSAGVAVSLADLRRAAELAGPHDKRFIEQAALLQIIQQRAEGLIGRGHEPVFVIDEIPAVCIPIDAHILDAVVRPEDGHQRHAALDQPPRLQHRLAVRIAAVLVTDFVGLLRQIERVLSCSAGQKIERSAVMPGASAERAMVLQLSETILQVAEQRLAALQSLG